MRYLFLVLLAGCSTTVATSNPACIFMCQNTGAISTEKEKSNQVNAALPPATMPPLN